MEQDALNSIMFKLNMLVDKVVNLEYKFDLLHNHLKHKAKKDDEGKPPAPELSPSQTGMIVNNATTNTKMLQNGRIRFSNQDWNFTTNYEPALDNVFNVMDINTLKMVRLVCKSWNLKAVPFLSSKSWINLHTWEQTQNVPVPLADIYQMMDSGSVDGIVLFKNLAFTYSCFCDRELEAQVILREFGNNLTSISFDGPKTSLLKQVLDQWCPNLDELIVSGPDEITEDEFTLSSTLKLKSLKMVYKRSYRSSCDFSQPLIQIAKLSPQLTSISMGERNTCSAFFTGISPFPEVTRNITDLDILDGDDDITFDLFLPKVVKLNIRTKCSWVTPLLCAVAGTLQTLTLGFPFGRYFDDDDTSEEGVEDDGDHNIFNDLKSKYPDLDGVRVLKIKGFLQSDSSIRSLEFDKMKNLQVLYVNVNEGDLDSLLLKSDLVNPVSTLRKLTLIGSISCALSFQILVTLFPNIIKLKLGLSRRYNSEYTMSDCLKDGLPKFAVLESLKTLSLYFNCVFCEGGVGDVIGKLKDLPGLTELELGNIDEGRRVVTGVLVGIKQVPKISLMKLVNIVLCLTEAQALLDDLKSRGIRLQDVEDIPDLEKM